MNRARYERLQALFEAAADLDAAARRQLLDRECAGDESLRQEVLQLLRADASGPEFGDGPQLLAEVLRAEAPQPPRRLGHYRIVEKIAEGGMGVVYLGEQDQPRRQVAVKLMRPGVYSEELRQRFRFEAELLGRLQHPGIAQIYEAGEVDGDAGPQPFYAMEYIDGTELRSYAKEHGLSVRDRVELLARLCDAVQHAHQKGIVHRDLKPGNVLVTRSGTTSAASGGEFAALGQPKVLDFGVSCLLQHARGDAERLTRPGHLLGTLDYMSPEQAAGEPSIDVRADVYSLGVIGFELLSGRLPRDLGALSLTAAVRSLQEQPAPRLCSVAAELSGDLSLLIGKALCPDPGQRFATAAAFAADLRHWLAGQPITARAPSLCYRIQRLLARNKAPALGVALALLGLAIGAWFVLSARYQDEQRRLAEAQLQQRSNLSAYATQLQTAMASLIARDVATARRLLASADARRRGFEWDWLGNQLAGDALPLPAALTVGASPAASPVDVQWSRDGRLLAAASRAGRVTFWDAASCRRAGYCDVGETIVLLRFAPDGSSLWIGSAPAPGRVRLSRWRVPTRQQDGELQADAAQPCGAFVADGAAFVLAVDDALWWIDADSMQLRAQRQLPARVTAMAPSPDGTRLGCGLGDGRAAVLSLPGLDVLYCEAAGTGPIAAVAFLGDGALLACGGLSGAIAVLDAGSGEGRATWTLADTAAVAALCGTPDGRLLVASQSPAIAVFDPATGIELVQLLGHQDRVAALALAAGGRRLASASADGSVRLWDGRPVAEQVAAKAAALAAQGQVAARAQQLCRQSGSAAADLEADPALGAEARHAALVLLHGACSGELLRLGDDTGDGFGLFMAASADTVVVGAPKDGERGLDGGAAYVFVRDGPGFWQQQKLLPEDADRHGRFGRELAVDGDTALVGAPADCEQGGNAGAAYLFERDGARWRQLQKLLPGAGAAGAAFGNAVALGGDTAVIAAETGRLGDLQSGVVSIHVREGPGFALRQQLVADDRRLADKFGCSVALDGDTLLVGALDRDDLGTNSGACYVFERRGGAWVQRQKLLATDGAPFDWFGRRVAVSGDTAVVTADGCDDRGDESGAAYVFERRGGRWTQQHKLVADDGAADSWFGSAMGLWGGQVIVGANNSSGSLSKVGAAYLFTRQGATWVPRRLQPTDGASCDYFGMAVALTGELCVVSAPGRNSDARARGRVRVYCGSL